MCQSDSVLIHHLGMCGDDRNDDRSVPICMDDAVPEYGDHTSGDLQRRKEEKKEMIMTGQDTPYNKAIAEKRASITSDAVLTDAHINKDIENYIVSATEAQTLLSAIRIIVKCYPVSPEHKVRLIEDILKGDES